MRIAQIEAITCAISKLLIELIIRKRIC